jgi:hypothetical protein
LVTFDYGSLPRYDAAFLIGILHHVKQATPESSAPWRSGPTR